MLRFMSLIQSLNYKYVAKNKRNMTFERRSSNFILEIKLFKICYNIYNIWQIYLKAIIY